MKWLYDLKAAQLRSWFDEQFEIEGWFDDEAAGGGEIIIPVKKGHGGAEPVIILRHIAGLPPAVLTAVLQAFVIVEDEQWD